jgi:hypothetical protein
MKCLLEGNPYSDRNFQIEFDSVRELEELRDSLTHMLKYYIMCEADGESVPPLIYKIQEKKSKSNNSKK